MLRVTGNDAFDRPITDNDIHETKHELFVHPPSILYIL